MRKQQWCGALLALALVLTLLPTAAFAASGTAENPISISTATDLKDFRDRVNGTGKYKKATPALCAKLTDNIVLNDGTFGEDGIWSESGTPEPWTPIGKSGDYSGTFNGDGHTIKGLYINGSRYDYCSGLFGFVGNATIKNLTVTGYVKGGSSVGGIVGRANGSSTIQNCINYSTVTGNGSDVGGIMGSVSNNSSVTIQNCVNYGTVTGELSYVGGIVGSCDGGIIQNCANLGSVNTASTYAGGIVGYAINSTTMTACYNAGEVKGTSSVGGLLGHGALNMTSCYNVGRVEGTNSTGGLVGSEAWSGSDGSYTSSLTVNSCYYLDTAAKEALGNAEYFTGDTSAWRKTKTEFADGDVLALLKQNGTSNAWGECGYLTAAGMTLPLLSGQQADAHDHTAETGGDCTKGIFCTCGHVLTAQQSAHSFGGWTQDANANTHTRHCQNANCTESKTEACADSSGDGKCDVCGRALRSSTPYYPPSYAASVSETEHGSVTVSPKTAAAGTTVTVTVTPDQGYTLETLTVTDASGKELPLTDKGNGRFTFTQPSSKVTVRAAFMDDNTMLNFFADVKSSDYFYDAVLWAAQKGITSGISATAFGPNQPCTRAQIVTFLWRAAGSPVVNYAMSMTDVPADAYYAEAVRWALSLGVTTGTGAGAFSPDASCTRAQAVTFLARARNAKASGKAAFSDVPSGSYYADAVAWAAESGVTTGTSADAFSPDDVCTRAQIVTFLYRAFQ